MKDFTIQSALKKIIQKEDLTALEMATIMHLILNGKISNAQLGGFLIGMQMKGETITELVAATNALRNLVAPVVINKPYLIDIVGTGGDQMQTFNISTTSAFVVAAAGGNVAKHGNRSISSRSGSADVLEAAGIKLNLSPQQIAYCVEQIGIGFMYAPLHHSAMKYATETRKELGLRTFFNLLGPLSNPAGTKKQLVGVFASEWVKPIAEVLQQLGCDHAMVVHAEDGLDEISINAPTLFAELVGGHIKMGKINPEEFGLQPSPLHLLKVENAEESLVILKNVLTNKPGPARDIVALNAGAAIYVAGLVNNLSQGVAKALTVLTNGLAYEKFNALITLTQQLAKN